MLEVILPCLLILLVGLAALDLLLPSVAWRLHVWSQRRAGITGIQRTRAWEWVRIVRGAMMLLLAGAALLVFMNRSEAPDASQTPPARSPERIDPARLPGDVLEGIPDDELEALRDLYKEQDGSGR